MFHFEECLNVPEKGGRGQAGDLLLLDNKIIWGRGTDGGVHVLENDKWKKINSDGVKNEATLNVCGGRLVAIGGVKNGVVSDEVVVWSAERWFFLSHMLVGCRLSSAISIKEHLLVMGGFGDNDRRLDDVQVLHLKTNIWSKGPKLPKPCNGMSVAVLDEKLFVMGGIGLDYEVLSANIGDLTTTHSQDIQPSVWTQLPNVPYYASSVCGIDGMLLAIGGAEDKFVGKKTSTIHAFSHLTWKHVGDMPFEGCWLDTMLISEGKMIVVDGLISKRMFKVTVNDLSQENNEDDRCAYEEAMTKGYVETSVTKCLILGAAGVGKTHLKHLLLKKDPPQRRVSTGLADNPVRAISFTLAGVGAGQGEDDWFVAEDEKDMISVIGEIIKGGSVSMAASLADVVSTLPKMATDLSNAAVDSPNASTATVDVKISKEPDIVPVSVNKKEPEQERTTETEEDVIQKIKQSSGSKKLFGVKWIQFIDSGGQLQYHDILPLFVQDPRVTIFVMKLSDKLSDHPSIEYYGADGNPVSKAYRSSLSHQEILQHCIEALCSQNAHPLIIIVGTHRDDTLMIWLKESISKKNEQLKSLLKPASGQVLYNGQEMKDVIFPVNGLTPKNEDRCIAEKIRKHITSESSQDMTKTPIAWFVLEVILQRSSHEGVLTLIECQVAAKKRLYMEGDAFFAALHHLVHHNVFLYYPKVLPQTVFCDPQVVLTKVTELVQYHHKLKYNPDRGLAMKGDLSVFNFRDHGVLSVGLLKEFPKHYQEGLFTAQDLLKLLQSRGAIAKIGEDEYLMPALLPNLDSTQVSKYCERGASLMIRFHHGYIPSGLFCCVVAHLLSTSWNVCMNGDQPLCLYRKCIRLEHRNTPDIMTLIDMSSYVQVHIQKPSSEVCSQIRDYVYSSIRSACNVLKYYNVQVEDAFLCTGACCSSHLPHLAVIRQGGSVYKWKCTIIGDQTGDLNKEQLMWLSVIAATSPPSKKQRLMKSHSLSGPAMADLMNDVAAAIPAKWRLVGIQLKLSQEDLDNIQLQVAGRPHSSIHAFEMVLEKWNTLHCLEFSWNTMIDALEMPSVGEGSLAAVLRTKYL